MAEPKRLSLYSETVFESKATSGFPLSCPTLDLVTTWDASGRNVFIYRPQGQAVSKIHQVAAPGTKAPEAITVTWKPDGQFLAVGWSDGVVRLMGLENNKAAHHIPVCAATNAKISHIGWANCHLANKTVTELPTRVNDGIAKELKASSDDLPPSLPQELTFLEVDTALPKISPLPTGSAGVDDDATVFTLRTGIDFLFQPPQRGEYDQVNIMVAGTDNGKLQLNIYDSFLIGTFSSPLSESFSASYMISHASHSQLSTQAIIFAEQHPELEQVHVVPMDLPFLSSSPINLSLLGTKLTTLQKLLRYIKQAQLHMQVEWKNTREQPSRFLRSVQGDLEDLANGPRSIVPALYHTVVTGHTYEPVREWLLDSLAERGHKRWDKAVVSGLENLRGLVHENYLPALERCAVILSRLRGLAQFYDDRDDIGFSTAQVSRILDIISCLSLVGHKILSNVMDELEHFNAFSTWLRFQIDRMASSSTATDELTEKEATMDASKVLVYIEKYLTQSPLDEFFDDVCQEDWQADWDHIEDGLSLLPILDAQLNKQESGQASRKALQHVEFLVSYVTSWSNKLFSGIAEAQKRSVRFGQPVKLSIGQPIKLLDMRMCQTGTNKGVIYVAASSEASDNKVHIFRSGIDIMNGISSSQPTSLACIDIGKRKLIDIQFLNDESLVLACSENDSTVILLVPVESEELDYVVYNESSPNNTAGVKLDCPSEFVLPPEYAMRPVRMKVHDKTDLRGHIPERICLLAGNRTTWKTFTLPEQPA
ncbi:hypothetical protein QQS21_012081 [Conoideocrella luteorostrata]|uniref:Anaphase-promoting complex subunit 4 n=1 Tax=Conoideocrella luteorostrata TaxID=1105319 RepID=A0AAJ0FV77_9HYPO|nr:hypothetical protein QQS21_012081 [Conoideocrella luteorostrata]